MERIIGASSGNGYLIHTLLHSLHGAFITVIFTRLICFHGIMQVFRVLELVTDVLQFEFCL